VAENESRSPARRHARSSPEDMKPGKAGTCLSHRLSRASDLSHSPLSRASKASTSFPCSCGFISAGARSAEQAAPDERTAAIEAVIDAGIEVEQGRLVADRTGQQAQPHPDHGSKVKGPFHGYRYLAEAGNSPLKKGTPGREPGAFARIRST